MGISPHFEFGRRQAFNVIVGLGLLLTQGLGLHGHVVLDRPHHHADADGAHHRHFPTGSYIHSDAGSSHEEDVILIDVELDVIKKSLNASGFLKIVNLEPESWSQRLRRSDTRDWYRRDLAPPGLRDSRPPPLRAPPMSI